MLLNLGAWPFDDPDPSTPPRTPERRYWRFAGKRWFTDLNPTPICKTVGPGLVLRKNVSQTPYAQYSIPRTLLLYLLECKIALFSERTNLPIVLIMIVLLRHINNDYTVGKFFDLSWDSQFTHRLSKPPNLLERDFGV